jgi:CBS domain-containing protein/RNA polymerase-binding transcription factor DksA
MATDVKEWMSGDPVCVEPGASALEALELMLDRGIRHLPVVDAERLVVGLLSIDGLRAALPFAVSLRLAPTAAERDFAREYCVGDVMTHAPETLREGAELAEAAERMTERRVGCLPIVDDAGKLVGLLSKTDLLHALATMLWSNRVRERRAKADELTLLISELRRERSALTEQLDRYHARERELSTHGREQPLDLPERGADLTEVRLTETLDTLAARRLAAIDRALDHAAQGHLGICDRCGGRIPTARLRALPGTTLCVACARVEER